jgi:hypothetical protein
MQAAREQRVATFLLRHSGVIEQALDETARSTWGARARLRRLDDLPWQVAWVAEPPESFPPRPWEPRYRINLTFDAAGDLVRLGIGFRDPHPEHWQEWYAETEALETETLRQLLGSARTHSHR